MEALYSKLYDKYTKLKTRKASEMEQLNFDQEQKFQNYVSAADELIGYLTSEKDRLYEQISDLRREVASIRSAKDEEQEKYEKMLIEENLKSKQLLEEIERLHRKEIQSGSPVSSDSMMRKRCRNLMHEEEVVDEGELDKDILSNVNQPKCCRQRLGSSDDASMCLFQELVECLVDLKFSIVTQADDVVLITAVHESSGYSFSLRWVEGEEEFLYSVYSLGTFERVAPEWMRDVMLFSKSMCSVFFKRVSCIVKSW